MRRLRPCWFLGLFLSLAAPAADARAQADGLALQASLSIEVDRTGAAHLTVVLHSRVTDRAGIEDAVEQVLGCRLQNVMKQGQGEWWILRARCDDAFHREGLSRRAALDPAPLQKELRRLGVDRLTVSVYLPRPGFIEAPQAGSDRDASADFEL